MEMKDVGRIIGATALAVIPAAGGLYVFGKMKDNKQSTGSSALVGGLALTVMGVGVALLNYYLLGLNETAEQLTALIGEKQTTVGALLRPMNSFSSAGGRVGALPERVFAPFSDDFRKMGMLNVTRVGRASAQRVGCCGR